jgi:hypothetical protein
MQLKLFEQPLVSTEYLQRFVHLRMLQAFLYVSSSINRCNPGAIVARDPRSAKTELLPLWRFTGRHCTGTVLYFSPPPWLFRHSFFSLSTVMQFDLPRIRLGLDGALVSDCALLPNAPTRPSLTQCWYLGPLPILCLCILLRAAGIHASFATRGYSQRRQGFLW